MTTPTIKDSRLFAEALMMYGKALVTFENDTTASMEEERGLPHQLVSDAYHRACRLMEEVVDVHTALAAVGIAQEMQPS